MGRRFGLIQDATIMFLGLLMLTAAWGVTLSKSIIRDGFRSEIRFTNTINRRLGYLLRLVIVLLRYRCRWRVSHDCYLWYGKRCRLRQGFHPR
jgi:hypothetical protein